MTVLSSSTKSLNGFHSDSSRGAFLACVRNCQPRPLFPWANSFYISITSFTSTSINGYDGAFVGDFISLGCLKAGVVWAICIMGWMNMLFGNFTLTAFLMIISSTLKGQSYKYEASTMAGHMNMNLWITFGWYIYVDPALYNVGLYRFPLYADCWAWANSWANFAFLNDSSNRFLNSVTVWMLSSEWSARFSKEDFGAQPKSSSNGEIRVAWTLPKL